jgi:rubrerythrin
MGYSQYRLGLCYLDAGITEAESVKRQEKKRQDYLKSVDNMIETLRKFKILFLKNIKDNNILKLRRITEYEVLTIQASLNKDNSIEVITSVDNNQNTYIINSNKKNVIPQNIINYQYDAESNKLPQKIKELIIVRERQERKQSDFYIQLIKKLDANNISVIFEEFVGSTYRGDNPIWYWQSGLLDFNNFEIL